MADKLVLSAKRHPCLWAGCALIAIRLGFAVPSEIKLAAKKLRIGSKELTELDLKGLEGLARFLLGQELINVLEDVIDRASKPPSMAPGQLDVIWRWYASELSRLSSEYHTDGFCCDLAKAASLE